MTQEIIEQPKELLIGFSKDDNGDWILNTHKDYEIKEVSGKFKVVKKQPQYPKTFRESQNTLGIIEDYYVCGYKSELLDKFQQLLTCRDAYWKIAGEQMGLGKFWEPDWDDDLLKCYISFYNNEVDKCTIQYSNKILVFPTEEMRDEFYDNFKDLIEECKELL